MSKASWLELKNDEKYIGDMRKEEETPLFGSGVSPLYDQPSDEADNSNKKDVLQPSSSTAGQSFDASSTASTNGQPLHKPHRPEQNRILWLFHLLQGVAAVSALCLCASQLLPLFVEPNERARIGLLSVVLKVYLAFFCLLFSVVEADLPISFIQSSSLLRTYFTRGFLYSFIGLVCADESYSDRVKDKIHGKEDEFDVDWASVFLQISAYLLLAVGFVYMRLGFFRLRPLRDKLKQQEKDTWKKYREDWKQWRERQRD